MGAQVNSNTTDLRSEEMRSTGEVASGECQISNKAGGGVQLNGTSMGTEEVVGKEVQC